MSDASNDLLIEVTDGIARLTINRPSTRNNLTLELADRVVEMIRALTDEGETRVAIIRGAGDIAFSAGFDLNALETDAKVSREGMTPNDARLNAAYAAIERAPFPVIAAVQGYCIGAGLELAMACDLRIAAEGARFRMPPCTLGYVFTADGLRRFTSAIGAARTRMMFLTAEFVEADKAEHWGLVHEVVSPEALNDRVESLARTMAGLAPLALQGTKQAISTLTRTEPLREDWHLHKLLRQRAQVSADLKEGKQAAIERRPPVFTGS